MRAPVATALISVAMVFVPVPLLGGPAPAAVREMPCPDAAPAFDHTKINRDLKEPAYGSERPLYRYFAFGPTGETVIAMVADESKGTGSGVDASKCKKNLSRFICILNGTR